MIVAAAILWGGEPSEAAGAGVDQVLYYAGAVALGGVACWLLHTAIAFLRVRRSVARLAAEAERLAAAMEEDRRDGARAPDQPLEEITEREIAVFEVLSKGGRNGLASLRSKAARDIVAKLY